MRWVVSVVASCLLASTARAEGTVPELYRQSYVLEAKGDLAGALSAMQEIGQKGGADYVANLRRGWLLHQLARYDEAIAAYTKAIEQEPKAIEPKLGSMLPLMAQRRWRDAEKQGNDVLAIAPGEFTAQSRLAYINYIQGRWDKAEAGYRKALAAYPSNVEMRAGLAWSLLKQSKLKEARAEFQRILVVAPDHASAKEGMALLP